MSILKMERRGCDFREDRKVIELSNVGNYRVCIANIEAKNGRTYFLEFSGGFPTYNYRRVNKRTGEPLKKAVKELRHLNQLFIDTCFEDARGAWRDLNIERDIYERNLDYTKENILAIVNELSIKQYDSIEV